MFVCIKGILLVNLLLISSKRFEELYVLLHSLHQLRMSFVELIYSPFAFRLSVMVSGLLRSLKMVLASTILSQRLTVSGVYVASV